MAINAYLIFDGNCREALDFYGASFGVEPHEVSTFGDAGVPNVDEANKALIMHGRVKVADTEVMFSDNLPGAEFTVGNNVTLAIITSDEAYIRKSFEALSVGAKVDMPLQETPWSKCYGNLVDRYGINWQFSHEA